MSWSDTRAADGHARIQGNARVLWMYVRAWNFATPDVLKVYCKINTSKKSADWRLWIWFHYLRYKIVQKQDNCIESTLRNNWSTIWNKPNVLLKHLKSLHSEKQTLGREEFFRYDLNPETWKAFKLIHPKSPLVWILQRLIRFSQVLVKLQWRSAGKKAKNCCLISL